MSWYFLFPVVLNIILFTSAYVGTTHLSDWILAHLVEWLKTETWSFNGSKIIISILDWTMWILIRILFFFFYVWFGGYIILMALAPVFSLISERTHEILTNTIIPFNFNRFMKDVFRGIVMTFRNFLIELSLTILFFILGFIPIIGLLSPIAIFIVASYYYGFSFMDYSFERKQMSIHSSSDYVSKNGGLAIANGGIFSLTLAVPFIGVIFAGFVSIVSVVAATLAIHNIQEQNQFKIT